MIIRYVDVIHTRVGTKIPSGHLDFFLSLSVNDQLNLEDYCEGDQQCLDTMGLAVFATSFGYSSCTKMSLCTGVEMGKSHESTFLISILPG